MRVVLASRNDHKVREIREILAELELTEVQIVGLAEFDGGPGGRIPDVVEDGDTFAANALLKAHAICQATGLPALADDSGLTVDILGGAPGIFSARWSGTHGQDAANVALLLAQLADVPAAHRGAGFVCAAALALPDGEEFVEYGELRGQLTREPIGDGGFGYDPIMQVDGRTLAQFSAAEKNAISHRRQAITALIPRLADLATDSSW